jgi:hypothetical protein
VDIPPIRPANSFHVAINNDPNRAAEMPPGALSFCIIASQHDRRSYFQKIPVNSNISINIIVTAEWQFRHCAVQNPA